jgi:hypothetical protein
MIRQYDTRLADQKAYGSPNVLINLATAGPRGGLVECKGVDVNATAPHLMAVACGDPYVRVFDRRRVGTGEGAADWLPLLLLQVWCSCLNCICVSDGRRVATGEGGWRDCRAAGGGGAFGCAAD